MSDLNENLILHLYVQAENLDEVKAQLSKIGVEADLLTAREASREQIISRINGAISDQLGLVREVEILLEKDLRLMEQMVGAQKSLTAAIGVREQAQHNEMLKQGGYELDAQLKSFREIRDIEKEIIALKTKTNADTVKDEARAVVELGKARAAHKDMLEREVTLQDRLLRGAEANARILQTPGGALVGANPQRELPLTSQPPPPPPPEPPHGVTSFGRAMGAHEDAGRLGLGPAPPRSSAAGGPAAGQKGIDEERAAAEAERKRRVREERNRRLAENAAKSRERKREAVRLVQLEAEAEADRQRRARNLELFGDEDPGVRSHTLKKNMPYDEEGPPAPVPTLEPALELGGRRGRRRPAPRSLPTGSIVRGAWRPDLGRGAIGPEFDDVGVPSLAGGVGGHQQAVPFDLLPEGDVVDDPVHKKLKAQHAAAARALANKRQRDEAESTSQRHKSLSLIGAIVGGGNVGSAVGAALGPAGGMIFRAADAAHQAVVKLGTAPFNTVASGLNLISSTLHELGTTGLSGAVLSTIERLGKTAGKAGQSLTDPTNPGAYAGTAAAMAVGGPMGVIFEQLGAVALEVGGKGIEVLIGGLKGLHDTLLDMAQAANPSIADQYNIALRDTTAVIGRIFVPVLDLAREGLRDFADVLTTILPSSESVRVALAPIRSAMGEWMEALKDVTPMLRAFVHDGLITVAKGAVIFAGAMRMALKVAEPFMKYAGLKFGRDEGFSSSYGAGGLDAHMSNAKSFIQSAHVAAYKAAFQGGQGPEMDLPTSVQNLTKIMDHLADLVEEFMRDPFGYINKGVKSAESDVVRGVGDAAGSVGSSSGPLGAAVGGQIQTWLRGLADAIEK